MRVVFLLANIFLISSIAALANVSTTLKNPINRKINFNSDEHTKFIKVNGLKLAYQTFGEDHLPAVILIMGLGRQMTAWKPPVIQNLLNKNFRVIRFDNRDIGLSQKLDPKNEESWDLLNPVYRYTGYGVPYFLKDMAADVIGLMDHLQIERAHFVGVSLGGMITQELAIRFPERLITQTLIMSSTGDLTLAWPNLNTLRVAFMKPDLNGGMEDYIEFGKRLLTTIGSPKYQYDPEQLTEDIKATYLRNHDQKGKRRQLLAAFSSGRRNQELKKVETPTLVIHGTHDPLIPVAHGQQLHRLIPNSRLKLVEKMGHGLEPEVVEIINGHLNSFLNTY